MRSHILVVNVPARINVPNVRHNIAPKGRAVLEGRSATPSGRPDTLETNQSSTPILKHGRSVGSKDSQPLKKKTAQTSESNVNQKIAYSAVLMHEVILDYKGVMNEMNFPSKNNEISVHYTSLDKV